MARLFRGLLDILRARNDSFVKDVLGHSRGFDRPADDSELVYQETLGFWRMFIELTFQIYAQLSLFVGIAIVTALVVIAWPLKFIVELFTGSWFMKVGNYHYQPHPLDQAPEQEEPVLDEKNSKVVRRVVYEETKVPKTK